MVAQIVKTYASGNGQAYITHWQAEAGFPVWELLFYVDSGRISFSCACWADEGEPVDCPPTLPVRKACHAAVRSYIHSL